MNEQATTQELQKKVAKTTRIVIFTILGILVLGILFLLILNWILPKDGGEENKKKIKFYPFTN